MPDEYFINPLTPEIEHELGTIYGIFNKIRDKGINILNLVIESDFSIEYHSSFFFLFRNYLSLIDAISQLSRISSIEAIELSARSLLEIDAYLNYMLNENTTNRILSYQVTYAIEKLKQYRKLDKEQQEGRIFYSIWQNDELLKSIPFPGIDYLEVGIPLMTMLERSPFKEIELEYKRTKKSYGKANWYSLWGGPRNIEDLFKRVNKQGTYEILYRTWSSTVHQSASFRNIVQAEQGGGVSFLRDPQDIFSLSRSCINIMLSTLNTIVEKILPNYKSVFASFYVTELRDGIQRINAIEIRYE
jgi:hypothetical protein